MIKLNLGCGTDLKKGYINIDKVKYNGIKNMDLDKFPYPFGDESVNEIIVYNILEHLKDWQRSFREMKRILKLNGIIKIIVPHFSSPQANSELHKTRFWWYSFTDKNMQNRITKIGNYNLQGIDLYSGLGLKKKKLKFIKQWFCFWNYIIEWLVNLHPHLPVFYENTIVCYLFQAYEIEVELVKVSLNRRAGE